MDQVLNEANQKVQNALDHLKQELSSIRAGRANPTLIDNLSINAYGSKMKLVELGTIAAPQPNLLTVQVWDDSIIQDVIKGIQESTLGLNPSFEGNIIRLPIPPLTAERREEFIKLAHTKMEEARIAVRQVRQSERERWQKEKEQGIFGEDELDRRFKILQELIERSMDHIDNSGKQKEEELKQV